MNCGKEYLIVLFGFNTLRTMYDSASCKGRQIIEKKDMKGSWTFFNTLGNWLFWRSFAIQDEKLHQSPIEAR